MNNQLSENDLFDEFLTLEADLAIANHVKNFAQKDTVSNPIATCSTSSNFVHSLSTTTTTLIPPFSQHSETTLNPIASDGSHSGAGK